MEWNGMEWSDCNNDSDTGTDNDNRECLIDPKGFESALKYENNQPHFYQYQKFHLTLHIVHTFGTISLCRKGMTLL